jgi:hypothetical protein
VTWWSNIPPRGPFTWSWTTSISTAASRWWIALAGGRRSLEPAHGSLHPETRELAESGGDRTQPVLPAMPWQAADTGSGHAAAGNAGVEPQDRPPADQDPLAVHAQEGPEGVLLQQASRRRLKARPPKTLRYCHWARRSPAGRGCARKASLQAGATSTTGVSRSCAPHAGSSVRRIWRPFVCRSYYNTFSGGHRPSRGHRPTSAATDTPDAARGRR